MIFWDKNDLILQLYIQPGAKKTEWSGIHGDEIKLRLNAPPVEGKANAALIDFLAKSGQLKKQQVIIESGELSRHKKIRLVNPGENILTQLQLPTLSVDNDDDN